MKSTCLKQRFGLTQPFIDMEGRLYWNFPKFWSTRLARHISQPDRKPRCRESD